MQLSSCVELNNHVVLRMNGLNNRLPTFRRKVHADCRVHIEILVALLKPRIFGKMATLGFDQ